MSLQDKIMKLRRAQGLSQEELADRLGISRQAVSKWESGQSTPDIDKIILLSDFFGVTTDYLLKDSAGVEKSDANNTFTSLDNNAEEDNEPFEKEEEEEEKPRISQGDAVKYIGLAKRTAKITAIAVFIFIISPILIVTLPALTDAGFIPLTVEIASLIGIIALFSFVTLGVGLCIYADFLNQNSPIKVKRAFVLEDAAKAELTRLNGEERKSALISMIAGVALCIISPIPLIIAAFTSENMQNGDVFVLLTVGLLLLIVAIGVFILSKSALRGEAFTAVLSPMIHKKKKTREVLNDCYWSLVVFTYLAISFATGKWGITWIIWPLSPIIPNLVSLIRKR